MENESENYESDDNYFDDGENTLDDDGHPIPPNVELGDDEGVALVNLKPNAALDASGKNVGSVSEDEYVLGPAGEIWDRNALRKAKRSPPYNMASEIDENYRALIDLAYQELSNKTAAAREQEADAKQATAQDPEVIDASSQMRNLLVEMTDIATNQHDLDPLTKSKLQSLITEGYNQYCNGNVEAYSDILDALNEISQGIQR